MLSVELTLCPAGEISCGSHLLLAEEVTRQASFEENNSDPLCKCKHTEDWGLRPFCFVLFVLFTFNLPH